MNSPFYPVAVSLLISTVRWTDGDSQVCNVDCLFERQCYNNKRYGYGMQLYTCQEWRTCPVNHRVCQRRETISSSVGTCRCKNNYCPFVTNGENVCCHPLAHDTCSTEEWWLAADCPSVFACEVGYSRKTIGGKCICCKNPEPPVVTPQKISPTAPSTYIIPNFLCPKFEDDKETCGDLKPCSDCRSKCINGFCCLRTEYYPNGTEALPIGKCDGSNGCYDGHICINNLCYSGRLRGMWREGQCSTTGGERSKIFCPNGCCPADMECVDQLCCPKP